MKRFLIWLVGVAAGVCLFLAAAMGVSYYFTTEARLPEQTAAFAGTELAVNGWCWHVPLLGGALDKSFEQAQTLTVQKLGTVSDAHPALTVPDWTTYSELRITGPDGAVQFSGTLGEYAGFAYPANGEYKAEVRLWHLAKGMTAAGFAEHTGPVLKNPGLETPARATGYYSYTFRFTLAAEPAVTLSAQKAAQGAAVGILVTGVLGTAAPSAECALGPVTFEKTARGWCGYLPVAYNAEAGDHVLRVSCGEQTVETTVRVSGRDYGTARLDADPGAESGTGGEEFRNTIWPLYTAVSGAKAWAGPWLCPVQRYDVVIGYGQTRIIAGQNLGRSNSTLLAVPEGDEVCAPAGGTVAYAGYLQLTGNTVVIDHGCGVRTYLYGLQELYVKKGDAVLQNGPVGLSGSLLTLDVKIGNKSIDPWTLFRGSSGLFWQE